eukprot:gene4643-9212_t
MNTFSGWNLPRKDDILIKLKNKTNGRFRIDDVVENEKLVELRSFPIHFPLTGVIENQINEVYRKYLNVDILNRITYLYERQFSFIIRSDQNLGHSRHYVVNLFNLVQDYLPTTANRGLYIIITNPSLINEWKSLFEIQAPLLPIISISEVIGDNSTSTLSTSMNILITSLNEWTELVNKPNIKCNCLILDELTDNGVNSHSNSSSSSSRLTRVDIQSDRRILLTPPYPYSVDKVESNSKTDISERTSSTSTSTSTSTANTRRVWRELCLLFPDITASNNSDGDDTKQMDRWIDTLLVPLLSPTELSPQQHMKQESSSTSMTVAAERMRKMNILVNTLTVTVTVTVPSENNSSVTSTSTSTSTMNEICIWSSLSQLQSVTYTRGAAVTSDSKKTKGKKLHTLCELSKLCVHPYVLPGVEPGPPYLDSSLLYTVSGKFFALHSLLKTMCLAEGRRVVICSSQSRVLDVLGDFLTYIGMRYEHADEYQSTNRILTAIDTFTRNVNQDQVEGDGGIIHCFLTTFTLASHLQLSLPVDVMVLMDFPCPTLSPTSSASTNTGSNPWTPLQESLMIQSCCRPRSPGSDLGPDASVVTVYRMLTRNSVEEKVWEWRRRLQYLSEEILTTAAAVTTVEDKIKKETENDGSNGIKSTAPLQLPTTATITTLLPLQKKLNGLWTDPSTADINSMLHGRHHVKMTVSMSDTATATATVGREYDTKDIREVDRDRQTQSQSQILHSEDVCNFIDLFNHTTTTAPTTNTTSTSMEDIHILAEVNAEWRQRKIKQTQSQSNGSDSNISSHVQLRRRTRDATEISSTGGGNGNGGRNGNGGVGGGVDTDRDINKGKVNENRNYPPFQFLDVSQLEAIASIESQYTTSNTSTTTTLLPVELQQEKQRLLAEDEVKRYLDVFWRRGHELSEWSKVSERLQRGQAQSQREVEIKALLERKLSMYKNPSTELNIQYGCLKGRLYSTEEDIFFLVMMKRFGHGNSGCWERIRREVQSHWQFRFNWLLRSRSASEIQRRCESLLLALQREEREEQCRQTYLRDLSKHSKDIPVSGSGSVSGEVSIPLPVSEGVGKRSGGRKRIASLSLGEDGDGGYERRPAKTVKLEAP